MKLALLAYGTRGDVQPFLALGHALRERGHEVRIVAPRNAEAWIKAARLPYVAFPLDVQALFGQPEAQRMLAAGDIRSFFKWLGDIEAELGDGLATAIIQGTEDADAIVTHALMQDRAAAVGTARGIPVLPVHFFPVVPSGAFANPFISTRSLRLPALNRLTHWLLLSMLWKNVRHDVDRMRTRLGLGPARSDYMHQLVARGLPVICAYSRHVFGAPADWPAAARITGHWRMPATLRAMIGERAAQPDLSEWLGRGPAPVYLGFGSMPILDPAPLLEQVARVLERFGARALFASGWTALARDGGDESIRIVDRLDHDQILPRCAAAVHHGGSGTTMASLAAGLPTVICSVFADQPFWGRQVERLGVGTSFQFTRLNEANLERSLAKALHPRTQFAAQALARRMADEDGLGVTVTYVERELGGVSPPV